MQEGSIKALQHLNAILEDIDKQNYPKELYPMKDNLIKVIKEHKDIYKGIDKKDIKAVSKQLDELWNSYTDADHKAGELYDFSLVDAQLEKAQDPSPVFESEELKTTYKEAGELLKQKKYRSAFEKFSQLRNKLNKESVAYDFVTERLCDVIGKSNNTNTDIPKTEELGKESDEILKYAEEILAKEYSPLFCDFFVVWRTIKQELYGGMSNWSQIPNWDYNLKRKELLEKLIKHIGQSPLDIWTYKELGQLKDINNIERGGDYGNDTLAYLSNLYMDPDDQKKTQKK